MNPLTLSKLAEMSRATQLAGSPESIATRICKDTREILPGDLYVALRGERFDGNLFLAEAASKGAVGALCDAEVPAGLPRDFGILYTPDSQTGLTMLASAWRDLLSARAVVVTGSSGKTSTKDFTAAVLAKRFRVASTVGNLNNQIGLPLSILAAGLEDEVAVWEIGMNHRGEIAPLAGLARPDIAIITNIGTAHIEHLGSQKEIAREKGDLLERLPAKGHGVITVHDEFRAELRSRTAASFLEVGCEAGELRATKITHDLEGSRFEIEGAFGRCEAYLPVPGKHMITNSLLAVGAGLLCGVSLQECVAALSSAKLAAGRLNKMEKRGVILIDDTYNANPESMVAALETLAALPGSGRKIAVLGKMGELGSHAHQGYGRVGAVAAATLDMLLCVGSEASEMAVTANAAGLRDVTSVPDNVAAAAMISSIAKQGDVVLLKASRSARMEEVLNNFA